MSAATFFLEKESKSEEEGANPTSGVTCRRGEEEEEKGGERKGCLDLFAPQKSCRCCREIGRQQLCVYVWRLDDIRSHMDTQFAAPTLQLISLKRHYKTGVKYSIFLSFSQTHTLLNPLSVSLWFFIAVFFPPISLTLHIK